MTPDNDPQEPVQPPPVVHNWTQPPAPVYSQDSGSMSRLIPTKNMHALLAYYFSVFGLLCTILGPVALVLGISGLKKCKADPDLPGKAHAWVGIILGAIELILLIAVIVVLITNWPSNATSI